MSLEDFTSEDRELATLMRQLANDPSTRKDALRLTKKLRPDLPIPELEIEDRTTSLLDRAEQRVRSLESRLQERDAVSELQKRRESLIKRGLAKDDEDVQAIERIMLDKKIHDHETAAEYNQWMKQAATPTPTGYNPNPMKKFDLSAFQKNPVQSARDMAAQALSEIRRPTRPIGL